MALSWNEIKERAVRFSKEWENATDEDAESQSFLNDFFNVFGISRRRVATFEKKVRLNSERKGSIDLLWKSVILIEQKSRGLSLDKAFKQAIDYFPGLSEKDLPKYILVSDFGRFRLFDLEEDTLHEFALKELVSHVKLFGFIAGYQKRTYKDEDPVNIEAAELMGKLHDQLKAVGYEGHPLEVYLVRLLFCMFADDTTIFEKNQFSEYLEQKTNVDGSDLAAHIERIFYVLNTPKEKRLKNLDDDLNAFPHVNGKLFEESLPPASFDSKMREILLECCSLNWGKISPAIFGSLFQSVMDPIERRAIGGHYTIEKNILKVIKPLFLDNLYEEFKDAKGNRRKLEEFHQKLASLSFLDPACGCGNFLVVTYRELRKLEMKVLHALYDKQETGEGTYLQMTTNISIPFKLDVDSYYGIEIEEFPAQIAQVAMWLMDHQMNMLASEEFGNYYIRLPLKKAASILKANALRLDWGTIVPMAKLSFILGNPPFIGKKEQTPEQKADMDLIFAGVRSSGVLDYVTAWYMKAANHIQNTAIRVGFVSTNSISQGEQVGVLWNELYSRYHIHIDFAHRTFAWQSEARGKAHVHVVVIGFSCSEITEKRLYEYEDVSGEPHEVKVRTINPYLVEGSNTLVLSRNKPICDVPELVKGSEATDDGHLTLTLEEKDLLLSRFPESKEFIRPFVGGGDFINDRQRWCLWLKNASPARIRSIPVILEKIDKVRKFRLASDKPRTKKWSEYPMLFTEDRQPLVKFLMIPKVSSQSRTYIPMAFLDPVHIVNNTASTMPNATLYHFGILQSVMHMIWMRYTCGRTKSDYQYSNKIVYNNFPWPENPASKSQNTVQDKAQKILDVRGEFSDSSLADLYDPLSMPPKLAKAHQELDKAVDLCYRPQPFTSEANRMEFLFGLYTRYTQPLIAVTEKKRRT